MNYGRAFSLLGASLVTVIAFGQGRLTLDEALTRAKERNGSVQAAYLNYRAAQKNVLGNKSAYLPTVTTSLKKDIGRSETLTGPFRGKSDFNTLSAQLDLAYRILDDGNRKDNLESSEFSARAQEYSALQTLRSTLFTVHSRFFEALRTQELLRVQKENLARAQVILDQTKFRANPPIEDVPRKDILQAEADFQNARVSVLAAESRVSTTAADLKAVLAWDEDRVPILAGPEIQQIPAIELTLAQAIEMGLADRADLEASRRRVDQQLVAVRSADRGRKLNYTLDASYQRIFAETPFDRAGLSFAASFPVYDGKKAQSDTESARLSLAALQATLDQDIRNVSAEIESAFYEHGQNRLRFEAATLALKAAQVNFEAAVEAQREGAGNLIQVLTAQVSLTTAESNLVEATFDLLITDVRFRLVTGQGVPGE